MASLYCEKCELVKDEKEFYSSRNLEKYPSGKLKICKKCATMFVDNWDPETYKWILEEIDVPYIPTEWAKILDKYKDDPKKLTGMTVLGRYLSKMKLVQYNKYRWADSEMLEQKARDKELGALKAQGFTQEEIDEEMSKDKRPPKPVEISVDDQQNIGFGGVPLDGSDQINDDLTDEDKMYLRLKWGNGYRGEEWVKLEQLYNDMMNSYDIQGAGAKDTLIMICKASLRANQLIDAGDIEGFQKASKVYKDLMTSAKLTAAQIKEEKNDVIDSIGELVAMCEKDGFIPRYHISTPKDKVDRVIQDMQKYTRDLVIEELGLGNLIENAVKNAERERVQIEASGQDPDAETDVDQEEKLFSYDQSPELEDKDFQEFAEAMRAKEEEDEFSQFT